MKPTRRDRREKRTLKADYLEPLVQALGDATVLAGVRSEELAPVAYQLALYFGLRRDPATSAVLADLYERVLAERSLEERTELVEDLVASVSGGASSVLALLPVLQHERDAGLVRSAAMTFATRMAPTEGDVLTGPRLLRTLLDHTESDAVRAGLVGALVAMGDARVQPLLAGTWALLPDDAVTALAELPRTTATRLEVEWLLDGLEDASPARFATIAASLARLPAEGGGRILDLERELPAGPGGDALTVLRDLAPSALASELAPRLSDLARRAAPGALDAVSAAFAS